MPPLDEPTSEKTVQEVAAEVGLYPVDAFDFVQRGLYYTVKKIHGEHRNQPEQSRHIGGQALCEGLREFALKEWGLLAGTVLRRWNINSTMDFGRIVFAMVENRILQKTKDDSIDDFRNVFDFKSAFEAEYRIESKA